MIINALKQEVKTIVLKASSYIYNNNNSKVIYYHDVHSQYPHSTMSTSIQLFKEHINLIESSGYTIVSEIKNIKYEIEINFDDGFRGLYENFWFFLEKNIPVKIFIITDFIGKKSYLKKEEIEEMLKSGFLSIGSHTSSHRNLNELSNPELKSELIDSKKILEEMFDIKISSLCYPRGKFSDTVIFEAKNAGYVTQYSCLPGAFHKPFQKNLVNRSLVQHAKPLEFSSILHGADQLFFTRYLHKHYTSV